MLRRQMLHRKCKYKNCKEHIETVYEILETNTINNMWSYKKHFKYLQTNNNKNRCIETNRSRSILVEAKRKL